MTIIPENQLCERDCGRKATVFALGRERKGKFLCSKIPAKCPAISKKCKIKNITAEQFSQRVSEGRNRVTISGKTPAQIGSDKMRLVDSSGLTRAQIAAEKGVKNRTRSGPKSLVEDQKEEYRIYKTLVQKYSRRAIRLFGSEINPNCLKIGRKEFHIDHIYSIMDGFKNQLPAHIVGSPVNLQTIHYTANCSKNYRSDITKEELLERFERHPVVKELLGIYGDKANI